ncbi:YetF domain-containing protein [uncultured Hymenobacter sp.]|uniref:DUF421 domain-containing protein n=1 Tax=uncultured Hymenobacter sp. TaxID=170016 RepID=UPI0035CBA065
MVTAFFLAADIIPFDWQRILWSDDAPPLFLLEVVLRCVITYLLIIGALRVTGRRGVRQLSLFELSIILALGSAAGDTMLYDDTPVLHAVVVFVIVAALYRMFNWATEKYPSFSDWLEGKPQLLVEEGCVKWDTFNRQNITQKELFGELRQLQVEHLGQVRRAYIEATGHFSIYFYNDDEVKPGLPIWPERLEKASRRAEEAGYHACTCCGQVQELPRGGTARCPVCQDDQWLAANDATRVA